MSPNCGPDVGWGLPTETVDRGEQSAPCIHFCKAESTSLQSISEWREIRCELEEFRQFGQKPEHRSRATRKIDAPDSEPEHRYDVFRLAVDSVCANSLTGKVVRTLKFDSLAVRTNKDRSS
jgi:hypothetical protein